MSTGPRQAKARPSFAARSARCPIYTVCCKETQGTGRRWKSAGLRKPFGLESEKSFLLHHSSVGGSKKVPLKEAVTQPASPVLLDQPEPCKALGSKTFSPSNMLTHQQLCLRRVLLPVIPWEFTSAQGKLLPV